MKMIELLSLPRRPHFKLTHVKHDLLKSGLPINSLPGWEHIPFNSKLPMLKCPDNQVIFSKNKIGQSFKGIKVEFDTSGCEKIPEYNPLHDSNLKNFYARERNLKRLRENGEITQDNDVICNLKDFNDHRLELHKTQLYYILQEINRLETEQHDRMMIQNAEAITTRDHGSVVASQPPRTMVRWRRHELQQQRQMQAEQMLAKTYARMDHIAAQREMQRALIDHKKALHGLKMQEHWEAASDLNRKRLISLKKLFQFKKDRFQKNLQFLQEQRLAKLHNSQTESWEKRLYERIHNEDKIAAVLCEVEKQKKVFIENHRQKYAEKWAKIQEEIEARSRKAKISKHPRRHKRQKQLESLSRNSSTFCGNHREVFANLLDAELCEALNAAIKMGGYDAKISFEADDPIYKAAQFINEHIVAKYSSDLSKDEVASESVANRIDKFFTEAKKFVTYRATQIIAAARESLVSEEPDMHVGSECSICSGFSRRASRRNVAFSRLSSTIGTSSYKIHPNIDIRNVSDRQPTPAGSLTEIIVQSKESLLSKINVTHLCFNDMIFIEHYVIKFKRELIVGVGKRVFAAIRCHFQNYVMNVRKELLEMDKKFLIRQATTAILGHATNPLNFDSSLKICINVLSSEIIWDLQKHLLRPTRDPRVIVDPQQCCRGDGNERTNLCLFCDEKFKCRKCKKSSK